MGSVWVFFKLQGLMEPRCWQEERKQLFSRVPRMYSTNAHAVYSPPKPSVPTPGQVGVLEVRQQGPGSTS